MITRHFVDIGPRRVHYRRAGAGPPLLLVHQSPRSSAEYEPLMRKWGAHFTCLAPDTPGFGQSDPFTLDRPEVEDYADAAVAFLDAVGVPRAAAYGYHSGAIALVTALKRHPARFSAVALNGYAVWSAQDRETLGDPYVPPFHPTMYGEHLVWLWNRLLEQSWFFPWYDVRPETRLSIATDDPAYVQAMVLDLLASGNHYAAGYSAMIRAPRDIPGPGGPPVFVTASRRDPLHAHLDRIADLPPEWRKQGFNTPSEAVDAALAHLLGHPTPGPTPAPANAPNQGFLPLSPSQRSVFEESPLSRSREREGPAKREGEGALEGEGSLHWRGNLASGRVHLHDIGSSLRALGPTDGWAIDLPGHGLSNDPGLPADLDAWADLLADAITRLGPAQAVIGHGFSALLACAVGTRLSVSAEAHNAALPHPSDLPAWATWLPSPAPARYGEHMVRLWGAARAQTFFWPPHTASAANAIPFDPAAATPAALRERHLALASARGAHTLLHALATADWPALVTQAKPAAWRLPDWATSRTDVWRPQMETD